MSIARKIILLFVSFMALATMSQVKISGKVYDESEQPIEFATVRIVGTNTGTNTDVKGQY